MTFFFFVIYTYDFPYSSDSILDTFTTFYWSYSDVWLYVPEAVTLLELILTQAEYIVKIWGDCEWKTCQKNDSLWTRKKVKKHKTF